MKKRKWTLGYRDTKNDTPLGQTSDIPRGHMNDLLRIDQLIEDFDRKEQEKTLAEQYGKFLACPCEVKIHTVTYQGEDDQGHWIRIEHSVRFFDSSD